MRDIAIGNSADGAGALGAIGQHTFAYEIWGHTVNVTSRIQHAASHPI